MVQNTCCGDGKECIVTDVSSLADPCMASCDVFYRLPDGSIWLLNEEGDGYQEVFVANDLTKIDWNADPDTDAGISNRPFKAIAWGLKLDDDGNLTVDKLILPTPDWNVTDPDNKDFIKNKPFQTIGDNLQVTNGQLNAIVPESITHSELQQILSEDINSIAYANSADGTDGFTTVYPNLNLLNNTSSSTRTSTVLNGKNYYLFDGISVYNFSNMTVALSIYLDLTNVQYDARIQLWSSKGEILGNYIPAGQKGFSIALGTVPSITSSDESNIAILTRTSVTSDTTIPYSKLKLEPGSTATPYMPSASEVTTADWPKYIGFSNVVKPNKSASDYTWFPIPAEQIQSDWNETNSSSKAFIKNKPTILAEQVQSDWNETNSSSKAFIQNKPTIPAEQVQADWDETDTESPAFIKNKPTIGAGAHTITLEGSPLDLTVGDHTYSAFDSITGGMNFEFNATVAESNWDDTSEVRRLMFLEDGIDNAMEVTTYRLVGVEYSLPENNFTIDGVMTYQNVGGTFVYTLKVSVTKGGGGDTSNFVTLDTEQTILANKEFGEIFTTGKGEEGQVTTIGKDGSVTQIKKIASSNEYTQTSIASGVVEVQRLQDDGTPLRTSILTSRGVSLSTDHSYANLAMNGVWLSNYARVKVKNGIMVVHISGAYPSRTIDGTTDGNIKTVANLPQYFVDLLREMDENVEFMWSNYGGSQLTYPGRIDVTGEVRLSILPTSAQIVTNNRFSCYVPIIL